MMLVYLSAALISVLAFGACQASNTGTKQAPPDNGDRCVIDIHPVQPPPSASLFDVVLLSRPVGDTMHVYVLNLGPDTNSIYTVDGKLLGTLPNGALVTLDFTAMNGNRIGFAYQNLGNAHNEKISSIGRYDPEVHAQHLVNLGGSTGNSLFTFGISGLQSGFSIRSTQSYFEVHPVTPPKSNSNNNLVVLSLAQGDTLTLYALNLGKKHKRLSTDEDTPRNIGELVDGQLAVLTFTARNTNSLELDATGLGSANTPIVPYPSLGSYDPTVASQDPQNLLGPSDVAIFSFGVRGLQSLFRCVTSAH